jgi:hypothetical protein
VYIANDTAAINQTLDFRETRLKYPAELKINLPGVAQGLEKMSLLEALMNKETAPLAAMSAELGPLFRASQDFRAVAKPGRNGLEYSAQWMLAPPP